MASFLPGQGGVRVAWAGHARSVLWLIVLVVLVIAAVGSVKTLGITRRRGEELTPEGTTHHEPDGRPRGKLD